MCFSDASLPFCLSLFVQLFTQLYFSRDDACVFDCMRSERVKMKNWKSNKYVMHACNIVFTVEKLLLGLEMSFQQSQISLVCDFLYFCWGGAPKSSLFAFKSIQFILFFYWKSRNSWNYCRTEARAILLCRKITHGCI